jgi:lysophospholipase L1-like esterase
MGNISLGLRFAAGVSSQPLPAPVLPSAISGLVAWLDADPVDPPVTGTASGLFSDTARTTKAFNNDVAGIKAWADRSGNARHLINGSGAGIFCSAALTSAASRAVCSFIASSSTQNWLQASTAADWDCLHQGCTVFTVINSSLGTPTNGVIWDTGGISGGPGAALKYTDSGGGNLGNPTFIVRGTNSSDSTQNFSLTSRGAAANPAPHGKYSVICCDYDGVNTARLFVNNGLLAKTTGASAKSASHCAGALRFGDALTPGTPYFGLNNTLIVFNRVLTKAERAQVHYYIGLHCGCACFNVACVGDSITAGTNVAGSWGNANTYPARLAQYLGALASVTNFGIGSATTQGEGSQPNIKSLELDAIPGAFHNGYKIVCLLAGINNLVLASQTGANAYTSWKVLADEITADAETILIASTVLPASLSTTPPNTAYLDTLNAGIKGYTSANNNYYVIDGQAAFNQGAADSYTMTGFLTADGLHPNQVGDDLLAQLFAQKILQIGFAA